MVRLRLRPRLRLRLRSRLRLRLYRLRLGLRLGLRLRLRLGRARVAAFKLRSPPAVNRLSAPRYNACCALAFVRRRTRAGRARWWRGSSLNAPPAASSRNVSESHTGCMAYCHVLSQQELYPCICILVGGRQGLLHNNEPMVVLFRPVHRSATHDVTQ